MQYHLSNRYRPCTPHQRVGRCHGGNKLFSTLTNSTHFCIRLPANRLQPLCREMIATFALSRMEFDGSPSTRMVDVRHQSDGMQTQSHSTVRTRRKCLSSLPGDCCAHQPDPLGAIASAGESTAWALKHHYRADRGFGQCESEAMKLTEMCLVPKTPEVCA